LISFQLIYLLCIFVIPKHIENQKVTSQTIE
jgi:hypothetical protein